MKKTLKLAAIHSNHPYMQEEADPESENFDAAAPARFVEANLEKNIELLHEAGRQNLDLVCTHEDFKGIGHFLRHLDNPELFSSMAEAIPGPTSRKLGEIARKYNMYIIPNYYEKAGDKIYNTSVLIGRTGEVIGKYRKIHLPVIEKWRVTGGEEYSVFDTDIGKIGFAICYDLVFPEHCRAVALSGADIIIHQTIGWGITRHKTGEALVRVRAAENFVYMVVAKTNSPGPGRSCIIDNYGDILAEQGGREGIVSAEFTPEFDACTRHFDTLISGVESNKARLTLEREPSLYSILTNDKPPLLERYKGMELATSAAEIREVHRRWKEHDESIRSNKPVKINYNWDR